MNELKPCPFCGKEARIESIDIEPSHSYFIRCTKKCCEQTNAYKDKLSAIEAWNKRVKE